MVNRYVPIALNHLYTMLSKEVGVEGTEEINKGVVQEMQIKRKYAADKIEELGSEEEYESEEDSASSGVGGEDDKDSQEPDKA